jgi:SNF2 family DNA or RNA helicase
MTLISDKASNYSAKFRAFNYQKIAYEAIRDLEYAGIFHEQGLGKTKIAIDLALYWLSNSIVDSLIIVAKKGLIANWKREISLHTNLTPKVLTQDRNANFFLFNSPTRVYLSHYEAVFSEESRISLFLSTRRVGIILDESHKIKNPLSRISKTFHRLSTGFSKRVIMTGTPIANRPYDIWSQIFFLDQGDSLGTDFDVFKSDFDLKKSLANDKELQNRFHLSLAGLFKKINSFSVRETKLGADIILPQKEIRFLSSDWEVIQREKYDEVKNEYKTIVLQKGVLTEDNSEQILKRLLRLVQIASNPYLLDQSYKATPGKFSVLLDLLYDITNAGEKAIVWTSFTDNADWLTRNLKEFKPVKVHGKMAMDDRNRSISNFLNKQEVKLLIATPGAAKEGLTLTVSNHVIFYDRSFSLDDYLQSQDRIHRISQKKDCIVYNLIMENSIDEWVDMLLQTKELAAKLGQGDITREEYERQVDYSVWDLLKSILGINGDEDGMD